MEDSVFPQYSAIFIIHTSYFFVNEFTLKLTLTLHSTLISIKVNHFDKNRPQITKLGIFDSNKESPSAKKRHLSSQQLYISECGFPIRHLNRFIQLIAIL
jgi:hypothetical protein